jgi:erythritol kinase
MAWIAVDAGTSVVKAVAFADDGRELAVARANTVVLHPCADWSEQDMNGVWSSVVATVREAIAQCSEPVRGIVSTAQGDGCWLVDEQLEPTGNAILWNDGRAARVVDCWTESGAIERAYRSSGSVTYPGLANAIMQWLRENQPERIGAAKWSLTANGWLFARMTGRVAADLSDASNPFSDVKRGMYSDDVVEHYDAGQNAGFLPPIATGQQVVASLSEAAAAAFGLETGVPVVMAPYDIVTTAYGSGAAEAGQACVILGTTICAEVITASLDLTTAPAGTTVALGDGLHMRAMPTLTGCEALEWAAATLGVDGLLALGELASTAEQRGDGIFFLPYLSTAGERSPFLAPDARGSFHGLSLATKRANIAFAVYEGLSFVIRECLTAATADTLNEVRVCGGGSRSDLWCQMIADVTGVPVVRVTGSEIGARGAHLFALAITGETNSVADGVRKFVSTANRFEVSRSQNDFFTRRYEVWKQLRESARAQWALLGGLR